MKLGKAILVVLAGLAISGSVEADVDGRYIPVRALACSEVLSAYAKANLRVEDGRMKADGWEIHYFVGWIAGYMTRVNYSVPGKKSYFNDLIGEVAWIASWCRDNPSKGLSNAMDSLTLTRTGGA
jgi:hypothetical protein